MIGADELLFFAAAPAVLPLYEALRGRAYACFPDAHVHVTKTQLAFVRRRTLFVVSRARVCRGLSGVYLTLTFGLGHPLDSPRVAAKTSPHPGRWTHHVILRSADDIDRELTDWLLEAAAFAERR